MFFIKIFWRISYEIYHIRFKFKIYYIFHFRLGECEVCGANRAIYTCPKCEVKTCSLDCVRIHKKELQCDGIRDRTKFIRIKHFTDRDLHSDYRLLEECARFVWAVKRDEKKKFTRIDKDLPIVRFIFNSSWLIFFFWQYRKESLSWQTNYKTTITFSYS